MTSTPVTTDESAEPAAPSRGRRVLRFVLIGFAVTAAVVVALGTVLYFFGGPIGPSREVRQAYTDLKAADVVPPPPEQQFVVPIPGCRCHSDDPVLIVHHAEYRLRECSRCH
jgi:hypothetical protein